jgi:hypothetical protein
MAESEAKHSSESQNQECSCLRSRKVKSEEVDQGGISTSPSRCTSMRKIGRYSMTCLTLNSGCGDGWENRSSRRRLSSRLRICLMSTLSFVA